jgi:hypothetical protein
MSSTHSRQAFALEHPCYEAEETAEARFSDWVRKPLFRVLTVNSGFE